MAGYANVNGGNNPSKKKKIATIGISSLILVAMVVAIAVGVSKHHDGSDAGAAASGGQSGDVHTSMKAIQAICQPTEYKHTCVDSLTAAAGNTTDPKELIKIAFNVTMNHITEAIKHSTVLQEVEKDPMNQQALENCRELMDYAIGDLKHSFEQLGTLDLSKVDDILYELKVWLSAAITYEETCLDGFVNSTGTAGESMRQALNSSMELTSNALAIVADITSVLTSLQIPVLSRRLLSEESELASDGFPTWVSAVKRKHLAAPTASIKPNVVVAKDGSGKYKTIAEALEGVPKKSNDTYVIYIKAGVYKEQIEVGKSLTHVMMVGDGPTKTRITGNKNFVDGTSTYKTATVAVVGNGFMARDIGFENSAGAAKHQAVALRVSSEMSIFYNCHMDGYQDTLYAHSKRQFYRDCSISGTIDFVFGDAPSVFQNCKFVVRKPLDNQKCIVTAQGRKDKNQPTGIILHNCTIMADPEYYPVRQKLKSYLGRPWKEFSRTIIMYSQIDDLIQPDGWLPWMGDYALNTCFYAEINNKGPGSNMSKRVKWQGVKTLSADNARQFAPGKFLLGDSWITPTRIPYSSGV